jgi:hypothetical protein
MTLSLPKQITVAEVGPRDGRQSSPRWIETGIDPQSHHANGATRPQIAKFAADSPYMRYS